MERIVQLAIDCGMTVYGDYLCREISGEPRKTADLLGSPWSISSFMGHFGEIPVHESCQLIVVNGFTFRIHQEYMWMGIREPVTCHSFYRNKNTHLGLEKSLNFEETLDMTMKKQFRYIRNPYNEPGFNLVARGWVPLNGPPDVRRMYLNKVRLILLKIGLQIDIVQKIVSYL